MKKANKTIKGSLAHYSGGFFKNMFSSKSDRLEDGKAMFVEAGNLFKLSKNCKLYYSYVRGCCYRGISESSGV